MSLPPFPPPRPPRDREGVTSRPTLPMPCLTSKRGNCTLPTQCPAPSPAPVKYTSMFSSKHEESSQVRSQSSSSPRERARGGVMAGHGRRGTESMYVVAMLMMPWCSAAKQCRHSRPHPLPSLTKQPQSLARQSPSSFVVQAATEGPAPAPAPAPDRNRDTARLRPPSLSPPAVSKKGAAHPTKRGLHLSIPFCWLLCLLPPAVKIFQRPSTHARSVLDEDLQPGSTAISPFIALI
ncbi:hypothetical protein EDC01DRAFT_356059 [Geopyxis carbonaria]|nr:hypothetical protein EDC01DRAFT_356059 [Geopyxis carbonaria]